jgi:hypothetical protein
MFSTVSGFILKNMKRDPKERQMFQRRSGFRRLNPAL